MSSSRTTIPVSSSMDIVHFDHAAYMQNFVNIIQPNNMPSMSKEWKPKLAQNFERYLTPDELKKYVLNRPKIQKLIKFYQRQYNQSRKEIERQTKEILNEIGLARSLPVIRSCGLIINYFSKRISSGIFVNELNLSKVKAILGTQPVLYVPCHRSYCDFILMSYICFHYDIEIPGIAAGMDFYKMVGMGNALRKTGAFFMRRSFTGDDLYWDIFREYVYCLVTAYHTGIEFFIEGTRSRNFKALTPKIGLFSMTLQPYVMGDVPDIWIVPVSVSYDRLLEEQLFVYELLGVPKPKETTAGFLKALKIIDERFGRMYVDFGEPISVKAYFGDRINRTQHANTATHLQKLDKDELQAVKDLAFEVVHQQQVRIVITAFNLVSLYFAYKTFLDHKISLEQLCNGVQLLKQILEQFGALNAVDEKTIKDDIQDTLRIHSNIIQFTTANAKLDLTRPAIQMQTIDVKRLKAHRLSEPVMYLAVPALSLQLYINPCLFWLAAPALMVLAAIKLREETNEEIHKDQLRLRVQELSKIFANEFVLIPKKQESEFYRNLSHLQHFKVFNVRDKIRVSCNEISDILLSTIAPFLCISYQVTETIVEEFSEKEFTNKELLTVTQIRVEKLLLGRTKLVHPFCLSLDNINTALVSLLQNGLVEKRSTPSSADGSAIISYSCKRSELMQLRNILLQYCSILPFNLIDNFGILYSKL